MSRVLVVDEGAPQAGRDGGAARMVALLTLLVGDGHTVQFASLQPWPSHLMVPRQRLERLGVQVVAPDGDATGFVAATGADLDVVILSRLSVATALLSAVREHAPQAQVIYDAVHAEHLARYRLAKLSRNQPLLAAALAAREAERVVVAAADAVIATSSEDAAALRELAPGARVEIVTAVHGEGDPAPPEGERSGLVFLGFLGMFENELAARRLVEEVWPRVERLVGPTPLAVLGAAPPAWLTSQAGESSRLTVPGYLPDVDGSLRRAAAMVVPVRGGAGVKSKALHAFGRWLPVVSTADGLRGTRAQDGVHALVAETDDDLAVATARLLADRALGASLARSAAALLEAEFSPAASRSGLRAVLEGVHA